MATAVETLPAIAKVERPSAAELLRRARSFREELLASGGRHEAERRVPADVMQRLSDAELTNVSRSRLYGGFAYGPSMLVRLGYELGQGDGSAAWAVSLANCNAWFASYWGIEAQDDIWANNERNLVTAAGVPTGKCEPANGGYLISGRWPWASNCENSQWAFVSALIPDSDGKPTGTGWFLAPMTDLHVDQNSWFVSGMQGSGSKTLYADTPIFVPSYRVIRFDDIAERKVPGCRLPGNSPADFSFSTFGGAALVGPVLGMAQGAVNWFTDFVKQKLRVAMRPGAPMTAGQNPFVQERLGRAQAAIDAAVLSLVATLERIEEGVFAGNIPSVSDRIQVRSGLVYSARLAVDATNGLMELAGATAADTALPLQRFWRDINAASRHISLDGPGVFSMAGRHLLGMDPAGGF